MTTVEPDIDLYVEFLDTVSLLAFLSNGVHVPITDLYDGDGDSCEDIEDAAAVVAGEDGIGWFFITLKEFSEPFTVH